jgi:hypothetical protein
MLEHAKQRRTDDFDAGEPVVRCLGRHRLASFVGDSAVSHNGDCLHGTIREMLVDGTNRSVNTFGENGTV